MIGFPHHTIITTMSISPIEVESNLSATRVDVTESLVKMFQERREKGLAEYGQPMQPFISEPSLKHSLEELLDECVYMLTHYLEYQAMWKTLDQIVVTLNTGTEEEKLTAYQSYIYLKQKLGIYDQ